MKRGFLTFVQEQWMSIPPVTRADLSGKTVLVVGANVGLGFETAKHFATMNPGRLILGCRSAERGAEAVAKIERDTSYKPELWLIDLGVFASVKAFADKFEKEGGRLDILVMNAAKSPRSYQGTPDGWESTLQINHLSTALLSILLYPAMVKTAREYSVTPRLVVVASDVHYWASIDKDVIASPNILETLGSKEYCTTGAIARRYFVTKLLNVFFVRAFNDHLASAAVTVTSVNPGLCHSELMREISGPLTLVAYIMKQLFALPTEQGSRGFVWAALADTDDEAKFRGGFASFFKIAEVADFVLENPVLQERLWNETIDILVKVDPRVRAIADEYLFRGK